METPPQIQPEVSNQSVEQENATNITEEFPFIKAANYKDINEIIKAFPHLKSINQFNQRNFDDLENAKCFVIRSNNDDDVHKAIKYGIWTSTQRNIDKLNEVYQECKQTKGDIFLFFSVVKSGQFEGVARLISHVQPINFPYWWQAGKWRSLVKIEWLFIKDVAYQKFAGICNIEGQPITHSRDGSELNWLPDGKKMMDAFQKGSNEKSILFDFEELDSREQMLRKKNYSGYGNQYNSYGDMNQYNQQYQMMMNNMAMYWQQQMMANYYNQMPMQQMAMQQMNSAQQPYYQANQFQQTEQAKQFVKEEQLPQEKQEEEVKQN